MFPMQLVWADERASTALAKQLSRVVTFSSDFTQAVLDENGKILQQSFGKVQFNRPSLFYWHVLSPASQIIWYRNQELIVYDPELSQAIIKKVYATNDPSLLPLLLLTGDAQQVLKNFSVVVKSQRYFLTPKSVDKNSLLLGVALELTAEGAVREIQYQTTLGQRTKVSFDHVQVNKQLDRARFFEPLPKGTDLVHAE